jgi:hypothetical protein
MNDKRRKQLKALSKRLVDIIDDLGDLYIEESDSFENLTPGLQCAARGQKIELCMKQLDDAISYLKDVEEFLDIAIYS